jgi:hypothetical protein
MITADDCVDLTWMDGETHTPQRPHLPERLLELAQLERGRPGNSRDAIHAIFHSLRHDQPFDVYFL